jgi:hypothetical protein
MQSHSQQTLVKLFLLLSYWSNDKQGQSEVFFCVL